MPVVHPPDVDLDAFRAMETDNPYHAYQNRIAASTIRDSTPTGKEAYGLVEIITPVGKHIMVRQTDFREIMAGRTISAMVYTSLTAAQRRDCRENSIDEMLVRINASLGDEDRTFKSGDFGLVRKVKTSDVVSQVRPTTNSAVTWQLTETALALARRAERVMEAEA